jgi:hypothetical protein
LHKFVFHKTIYIYIPLKLHQNSYQRETTLITKMKSKIICFVLRKYGIVLIWDMFSNGFNFGFMIPSDDNAESIYNFIDTCTYKIVSD